MPRPRPRARTRCAGWWYGRTCAASRTATGCTRYSTWRGASDHAGRRHAVSEEVPMRLCHALALALILPFAPAVPAGEPASTYLGQEEREIKALSAGDIDAYLSGQGMGLARAAELNGYPGPAHVLELAAELGLSRDQLERTQALHASMRSRAVELGRQLVAEERNLDRLFRSG